LTPVHRSPFPPSLKSYCVQTRGLCCVYGRNVTEIDDIAAVIVIRVPNTTHLVADNEVCVTDTNRSVTDIDVYASHIAACVTGTDANTAGNKDFVTETDSILSVLKFLFPILRCPAWSSLFSLWVRDQSGTHTFTWKLSRAVPKHVLLTELKSVLTVDFHMCGFDTPDRPTGR
jgi:hypothetical protein